MAVEEERAAESLDEYTELMLDGVMIGPMRLGYPFLELLVMAFGAFGYDAAVTLFPEGEYSSTEVLDRPVARASIVPQALMRSIASNKDN